MDKKTDVKRCETQKRPAARKYRNDNTSRSGCSDSALDRRGSVRLVDVPRRS